MLVCTILSQGAEPSLILLICRPTCRSIQWRGRVGLRRGWGRGCIWFTWCQLWRWDRSSRVGSAKRQRDGRCIEVRSKTYLHTFGNWCGPNSRFEEIKDEDEVPASKKRERDSDAAQADEEKGSKKKKKNKKQKAEDGKAVPTGDDKPESKAKPESKSESKPKSDTDKKAAADSKTKKIEQLELPGGLKIGDVKVGTGPSAKAGDKVKMRYIGKHLDGKVFDSNTKGKPVCLSPNKVFHYAYALLVHFHTRRRRSYQRLGSGYCWYESWWWTIAYRPACTWIWQEKSRWDSPWLDTPLWCVRCVGDWAQMTDDFFKECKLIAIN